MNCIQKIWSWAFNRRLLEAWIWIAALLALAFTNPQVDGHMSLCLIKNLGWNFCPGCGLGHSIAWLFKGEVRQSFQSHPLGIIAVAILFFRIFQLFSTNHFTTTKPKF